MGKLFISYRRDDTLDFTGRLYERLAHHFGPESIFMDVEKIGLGSDFRQMLRDAISASDAVLVIIGRQWLTIADARGRRRLESPDDYVRFEVEEALARNIPVVPVVTHGMTVPRERDLPKSIAPLAFRTGVDVRSDQHFGPDSEQLIARLTPLLPPRFPLPVVPERLANLGFRGVNLSGIPAIIPPLVQVSAGVFLMGSQGDQASVSDESPQHRVEVGAFQIGKYPVTVAEYALAVQAGAVREPPDGQKFPTKYPAELTWRQQLQRVDHPVVCVSWEDANVYIAWLRKATSRSGWRLPSEAQWEKAARWDELNEVSSIYPWGDKFDKNRCNTLDEDLKNDRRSTAPVGSYPGADHERSGASPCGAEDMAGNVFEWTSSVFKPYRLFSVFSTARDEEAASHSNSKATGRRVMRGGGWHCHLSYARSASRGGEWWPLSRDMVGFRLAMSPSVSAQ